MFNAFILCIILANSVTVGATDYSLSAIDPGVPRRGLAMIYVWLESGQQRQQFFEVHCAGTLSPDPSKSTTNALMSSLEPIFTAIFTTEMCVGHALRGRCVWLCVERRGGVGA